MTEKPMKPGEPGDPRVSAAYREMADERPPEHLDHVILNAARAAARPRWNKAIAWLRPAAWVATIGVCLAIVIEISLLPDQESAEFDSLPQSAAPAAARARMNSSNLGPYSSMSTSDSPPVAVEARSPMLRYHQL